MYRSYKSFSNEAFMVDTENRILQLTSKHNGLDFDLSKTALGIQWQRYYVRQKQVKSRITFIEKKSLQEGRHGKVQKQRPEVFCKKRCFEKFRKIHRKTPVSESFFNKVADRPATLFKKETLLQVFSCEFYEICKNSFSTEHLQRTASESNFRRSG